MNKKELEELNEKAFYMATDSAFSYTLQTEAIKAYSYLGLLQILYQIYEKENA